MSTVLPSREALERDWPVFETPQSVRAPLSMQEKLARTTSGSTLTHVRMPDGEKVRPNDMHNRYGFTYNQWLLMRASLERLPVRPETTYCTIGGMALTLNAFEAAHNHIYLGQE